MRKLKQVMGIMVYLALSMALMVCVHSCVAWANAGGVKETSKPPTVSYQTDSHVAEDGTTTTVAGITGDLIYYAPTGKDWDFAPPAAWDADEEKRGRGDKYIRAVAQGYASSRQYHATLYNEDAKKIVAFADMLLAEADKVKLPPQPLEQRKNGNHPVSEG